jgi:hypothetical protein
VLRAGIANKSLLAGLMQLQLALHRMHCRREALL